jgi:hypothetical protein
VGIDRSDEPERGELARGAADVVREVDREGDTNSEAYALGEADDRAEYFESLRESAWGEAVERFRARWDAHRERWPEAEREPVDRSEDPEGSWRGDSNRYLDAAANTEVDARHERIAEVERNVVSPAMREIESCDPDRTLVGWEYRLKSADRLKDKVAEEMVFKSRNAEDALANVKDCIRYTFRYEDAGYATGVVADVERLKDCGFKEVELRNTWAADQYRGINSRWCDLESGQLFEVQFHTGMSFEAKQLTHGAYERMRNPVTTDAERDEIAELQHRLCEQVEPPLGAAEIPDYPRRGHVG